MRNLSKILSALIGSLLAFCLPLLLAHLFGPQLFPSAIAPVEYHRARLAGTAGDGGASAAEADLDRASLEPSDSFRQVAADPRLDPGEGKYFIVSMKFQISNFGRSGKRQKLVAKYGSASTPFPGWAIAIRKFNTSVRPEVYWQNSSGSGGWYTFDNVRFLRRHWYVLTLVARESDLLSLYIQELPESADLNDEGGLSGDDEESDSGDPALATQVRFLGGYAVPEVKMTPTEASLQFAPRVADRDDFRAELKEVLVARADKLPPKQSKLMEFVFGGPGEVSKRVLPENLILWIDETGRDHSVNQRAVSAAEIRS